ncbi:patatin-like phospholipase family protein [Pedobacter antarcticus]|uniref:patatin-like phospholipase family protein n=1 Tax=Pedobacter antarcticus TaxID=34086 RepID=UPI00088D2377|nr:patatin-like phospholipase family protein [Pedobacter antarcticus]SDL99901.1 NTE family protein [Pedobacter antarcticus]
MTKVGIVLSGGGIRGIAHLGVLKALINSGITFSHISGTSAGSIVGAFYAAGIDPEEALYIFMETKLLRFIRPALTLGTLGLINIEHTSELLKTFFPEDRIEKLKIPLTIATTNFSEGKLVYFSEGPLIRAIQASSCIPGIFKPIMIDGQMYVDGAILNNFPVEPLLEDCDFIIGSSCNHLKPVGEITNLRKLMTRTGMMSVNKDMERKAGYCDLMIEPKGMGEISTFDMKKAETIYWLAYEETLKTIQQDLGFKQLLNNMDRNKTKN